MSRSPMRIFSLQNFLSALLVAAVLGFLWSMYVDSTSGQAWKSCRALHQEATCNHILGR